MENKKDLPTKNEPKSEYTQDINQFSSNPESESKKINTINTLSLDIDLTGKEYQTPINLRSQMRNKLNDKLKYYNQPSNNYVNEVMKSELKILAKENAELKFCLNSLNKKFDKEIKDLKLQNSNKTKELQSTKEIIKKNTALIELLGEKIMNYEKIFKNIEIKNQKKSFLDKNIREKLMQAKKDNEQLKKEIIERDEIIKSYKDEIDTKKEIFEEIDRMKNEMENYLKTMDKLYKEIENKDKEINTLQKSMELMESKHKQEVENITKDKIFNTNNMSNEELINDITKSKEKQIELTKELIKVQKLAKEAENDNIKLQEISKEANSIINNSIESRDKIKTEYDKAIKGLVEKYEKQIQIMKIMIVKQNEEFEAKLEELKKDKNKEEVKEKDDNKDNKENEEERKQYLQKLKKDNTMLIKQNLELKNMNEVLLSKMNELPNLNDKFNELFETVKLLKEENDLLKKSLENNGFYKKMTEGEEHEEDKEENELSDKEKNDDNKEPDENEKENNSNDNNDDNNEDNDENNNPKLSLEELQMLENLIKDVENGNGGNKEENDQKLALLENILKRLENKNENEEKSEENNDGKEEEEEEEKNNDELNTKKNKNEINDIKNKNENNELLKDKIFGINKTSKIYNKKHLKSSPKIIKKEKMKTEEGNDEEEENEDDENTPNQINENFYLYKPIKEGMLSFSLSKKNYSIITPNKYDEFLKVFDPETSVQYNTLEGLFIIPSNKCNQLFYYSSKKNNITELFSLKENHSGGCLFLDNVSKNIIALGGDESKAVEKFSFVSGKLDQLPELPYHCSKITCSQIENKIYCFFGNCKEMPNKSLIEYLDLDNTKEGCYILI